jgi:hypothetical protein
MRSSLPKSSLRFFKARLTPFTKPMFWGSATILTLLGVTIWQYWQHPEWIGTNNIEQPSTIRNNTANQDSNNIVANPSKSIPQLSEEDLAVAADIDNSELLLEEIQAAQTQVNLVTPETEIEKNTQDDFLGNEQKSNLPAYNSLSEELKPNQQNSSDPTSTNRTSSPFSPNQSNSTTTANSDNDDYNFTPSRSIFTTQKFGSNRPVNYLKQALDQQNNQRLANQTPTPTSEVEQQPQTQPYTGYNPQTTNNSNDLSRNRSLNYPNYSYSNDYKPNTPYSSVNPNNNYNSRSNNLPQNNYQQFRPSITTTGTDNNTNVYGNPNYNQPSTNNPSNPSITEENNTNVYGSPNYNQPSTNNTSNSNSQTSSSSSFPTFSESTDFNSSAFDNSDFVSE